MPEIASSEQIDIIPTLEDLDDPDFVPKQNNRSTLIEKHTKILHLGQIFWQEWRETYLLELRERHKGVQHKRGIFPKEGDIVLIDDQNHPRSKWQLGKIEQLISERTAKLRIWNKTSAQFGTKLIERATKRLYPLELEAEVGIQPETKKQPENVDTTSILRSDPTTICLTLIHSTMDDDYDPNAVYLHDDEEVNRANSGWLT